MRRNLLIELMQKSGENLAALYLCVSGHPAGTLSHLSHGDMGDHLRASIAGVRVLSACECEPESGVHAGCLEPSVGCHRMIRGKYPEQPPEQPQKPLWRRIGSVNTLPNCAPHCADIVAMKPPRIYDRSNLGEPEMACMQCPCRILRSCANPG